MEREDMVKRSLWMGSLEPHMNEAVISMAFEKMGETVQVKFVRDKFTKALITTYCFVEFADQEHAENALKTINGKALPNLPQTSFHLAPSRGGTDRDSQGASSRNSADSLFVGGLSDEVTESDLFDFFKSRYTTVKEAKLCRTHDGSSKGFGFVRFFNETDRLEALRRMNGVRGLGSKQIFVSQATAKPNHPKDRLPQQQSRNSGWSQQWQHQDTDGYYIQQPNQSGQYQQQQQQPYSQTTNQPYYGGDWSGQAYQQYQQGYDYNSQGQNSSQQQSAQTQVKEAENNDDDDQLQEQELDVDVDKMNEEFIQNNEDLYSSLEKSRWHFVDSVAMTVDNIKMT